MKDLLFITLLSSSLLVLDTIRKRYFPAIFTEILPSYEKAVRKFDRGMGKGETLTV
jgi:hypothetical protein